ncbi:hypothetical protein SARC_16423, partial [Sphaeroforma arctica JP610]
PPPRYQKRTSPVLQQARLRSGQRHRPKKPKQVARMPIWMLSVPSRPRQSMRRVPAPFSHAGDHCHA